MYTLDEFKTIVENCSKKKKFVVYKMTKDDFFGTSNIEKLVTNRKIYNNNEKVSWLNTRVIKVKQRVPFFNFYEVYQQK